MAEGVVAEGVAHFDFLHGARRGAPEVFGMLAPQQGGTTTHRPGHPPAILLVEDDAALRCAMEALLVHYGYLVVAAGTARDTLAALHEPAVPPAVAVVALGLSDARRQRRWRLSLGMVRVRFDWPVPHRGDGPLRDR